MLTLRRVPALAFWSRIPRRDQFVPLVAEIRDDLNNSDFRTPARILLVHNRYKFAGGEDTTFESERDLLARMGHDVEAQEFHNEETDVLPPGESSLTPFGRLPQLPR